MAGTDNSREYDWKFASNDHKEFVSNLWKQMQQFVKEITEKMRDSTLLPPDKLLYKKSKESLLKAIVKMKSNEVLQEGTEVTPNSVQLCRTETLKEACALCARAILDFTFVSERALVDADFPSNKKSEVGLFLDTLQSALDNATKYCHLYEPQDWKETKPIHLLGIDLWECLHWRRGALLYMYIATLVGSKKIKEIEDGWIQTSLWELDQLTNGRQLLQAEDNKETVVLGSGGEEVQILLSLGIYSDTHLLALMYSGELYYWKYQYFEEFSSVNKNNSTAKPRTWYKEKALECLTKYETIVSTYLSNRGWNARKAREIIDLLNK